MVGGKIIAPWLVEVQIAFRSVAFSCVIMPNPISTVRQTGTGQDRFSHYNITYLVQPVWRGIEESGRGRRFPPHVRWIIQATD